jgi:hypothetical protein
MATKSAADILAAFEQVQQILKRAGLSPKLHRLENECSEALKTYLNESDIKLQLSPPYNHRANAAERAIRTFKNHFIAGLCSKDPKFPLHLWDRLVPQALLTLNLMRASRINLT